MLQGSSKQLCRRREFQFRGASELHRLQSANSTTALLLIACIRMGALSRGTVWPF